MSRESNARIESAPVRGALLFPAAGFALLAFYFAQFLTLAPNSTDDGLILGYIHDIARGKRPFWDFVDAYGPLNWVFPALFYRLAGEKVWAIRLWLVIVKLTTVGLSYRLVRRLSDGLYALLAAAFMAVLLGQGWQSLQTAYAFLTVLPLLVGTWYLLLLLPLRRPERNIDVAAILTSATVWTKVNTGFYLFAGGMFWLFYWAPSLVPAEDREAWSERRRPTRAVQKAGLVAYGLVFTILIRRFFNMSYVIYLLGPLLIALWWTARATLAPEEQATWRWHAKNAGRYAVGTSALSLAILFGYYGLRGGAQYASELGVLLSRLHYFAPFPALGKAGHYKGLNEFYWIQLPCVATVAYLVWLGLGSKLDLGRAAFGAQWIARRAQTSGLFVFLTLHAFALYSRSDETHIFQVLVLVPPVLFVLLFQIEAFLRSVRLAYGLSLRIGGALVASAYASTLAVRPHLDALVFGPGDFASPHLQFIRYRPLVSPSVETDSPYITNPDWDHAADEAGRYIDSVTATDEEILVLMPERILHYLSNTRPAGGRYYFYFYMVSVGLLDRAGFDALVPPSVLEEILAHPPRVIVSAFGAVPLAEAFPEFRDLRDHFYTKTRAFRHILIYERNPDGVAQP